MVLAEKFQVTESGHESREMAGRPWHVGIYSHSGAGKTHLIGTAGESEKLSPVLLIDAEDGSVTIDANKFPNIHIIRVSDYIRNAALNEARTVSPWDAFNEIQDGVMEAAKEEDFPYKLIGWDGMTRVQDWCDDGVVAQAIASSGGGNKDSELSTQPDFRRIASRMAETFWRMKSIQINTIVTAKQRTMETEDSTPSYRIYMAHANFYPKVLDEFEGCFDVIARLAREMKGTEEVYVCESRLSMKFLAKSRGQLEGRIEAPTADAIFSQLGGTAGVDK